MTLADALAERAVWAATNADHDQVRVYLLTNLAAARGDQDEGRRVRRAFPHSGGPGPAAYLLAADMHARTQDDFFPPGRSHLGAVVVPAVLAVADGPVHGAVAAGYAVMSAVSEAYAPQAQARGLRPTGVFGPLGGAAAAAVALGADADGIAGAIALASSQSAGTNQSWLDGSDEWLLEVAAAARSGVEAALLAAGGVRGAPRAIEGAAGWARALFGDPDGARLAALMNAPAALPRVACKPYPVSGIAQVPTHLAAALGRSLHGRMPRRITVTMAAAELAYPGSSNRGPFRSRADSLMSVARCVALAYLHGGIPYRRLLKPPDEAQQELLAGVELVADTEREETCATVAVELDGETHRLEAHGDDLLYPDWTSVTGDLRSLARRYEAPTSTVERLAEAVGSDAPGGALLKESAA